MGKIEKEAKVKRRKTQVQRIILGVIAGAGALSVLVVAPGAIAALGMLDRGFGRRKKHPRFTVHTAFTRLLEKGHIVLEQTPKGKFARLTEEGKRALARMVARSPDTRKHKRWDKRWRMVIYDIKNTRGRSRRQIQKTLQSFGFLKLQNSVWVYPYDCEELVTLLKADFKLGTEVLYVVVEHIENDGALKEHFSLK
jgi:DNA-binding transcriptional regulator PaaX